MRSDVVKPSRRSPIILGGIKASLRRIAHLLIIGLIKFGAQSCSAPRPTCYFMAMLERRALVDVSHRIAKNGLQQDFSDIGGLAFVRGSEDAHMD
jgi:hypothetical protein